MQKISATLLAILVTLCLTSCVMNYGGFPEAQLNNPPTASSIQGTLFYRFEGRTLFNGYERLTNIMRNETPFTTTERTTTFTKNGYFLDIKIKTVPPSTPALIFGYISASLAVLTPFWSTQDGYEVFYELYEDGNKIKTFTYEIKRKSFFWLVMIPFSPANFATYKEEDAFQGVTYQFFNDAKPYFK